MQTLCVSQMYPFFADHKYAHGIPLWQRVIPKPFLEIALLNTADAGFTRCRYTWPILVASLMLPLFSNVGTTSSFSDIFSLQTVDFLTRFYHFHLLILPKFFTNLAPDTFTEVFFFGFSFCACTRILPNLQVSIFIMRRLRFASKYSSNWCILTPILDNYVI